MKSSLTSCAVLLTAGLLSVQAQNVVLLGGPGDSTANAPAPATAPAPVVSGQAPTVVIQIIQSPAPVCQTAVPAAPCPSSVVYQSAPYVPSYGAYPPAYYRPQVIYFGRGQGYRQGYNFTRYR